MRQQRPAAGLLPGEERELGAKRIDFLAKGVDHSSRDLDNHFPCRRQTCRGRPQSASRAQEPRLASGSLVEELGMHPLTPGGSLIDEHLVKPDLAA